jgi:hypothetical protein
LLALCGREAPLSAAFRAIGRAFRRQGASRRVISRRKTSPEQAPSVARMIKIAAPAGAARRRL